MISYLTQNIIKDKQFKIYQAAQIFATYLEQEIALSKQLIKTTFEQLFGCLDNQGEWLWKDVYEAVEIAQIIYLRKLTDKPSFSDNLRHYQQVLELTPTHTRRSKNQIDLQQFSTPVTVAYLAFLAAKIEPNDVVLEPSAGNGILAAFAQKITSQIYLNEIDDLRAENLRLLFRDHKVSQHNAEQIHDRLIPDIKPTVILANPPFTANLNLTQSSSRAIEKHLISSLERLESEGRLVLISQESLSPNSKNWKDKLIRIQTELATLKFSAGITGKAYYKHGTTINTRISVFDKHPAKYPQAFPKINPPQEPDNLLELITTEIPPRITSK